MSYELICSFCREWKVSSGLDSPPKLCLRPASLEFAWVAFAVLFEPLCSSHAGLVEGVVNGEGLELPKPLFC